MGCCHFSELPTILLEMYNDSCDMLQSLLPVHPRSAGLLLNDAWWCPFLGAGGWDGDDVDNEEEIIQQVLQL